jgi:hypothetical protein
VVLFFVGSSSREVFLSSDELFDPHALATTSTTQSANRRMSCMRHRYPHGTRWSLDFAIVPGGSWPSISGSRLDH